MKIELSDNSWLAIIVFCLASFVTIGFMIGRMTAPACPAGAIERIIPDVQAPAHVEPSKVSGC
jgi:hypothetical protein